MHACLGLLGELADLIRRASPIQIPRAPQPPPAAVGRAGEGGTQVLAVVTVGSFCRLQVWAQLAGLSMGTHTD